MAVAGQDTDAASADSDRTRSPLTGQVPQASPGEHFHSPPTPPTPSSASASFEFPTLELDGSLPDLTTHQAVPGPYPTPPAALSALGIRTMAGRGNTSESEGSLADQYDLIDHDDFSEMSNDDHETASITSNEQDHERTHTFDLSESDGEGHEQEHGEADGSLHARHISDSGKDIGAQLCSDSVVVVDGAAARQTQNENDLIDSYMTEDHDTPCQSVRAEDSTATIMQMPNLKNTPIADSLNILFVSRRDEDVSDMNLILSRVAAAARLSQSEPADIKVSRLPTAPMQDETPAKTLVCGKDEVLAEVQHCVAAQPQSFGSSALCLVDHYGYPQRWPTVSADGTFEACRPDLAIFHVRTSADSSSLGPVLEATDNMRVPAFIILEKEASAFGSLSRSTTGKIIVKGEDFIAMEHSILAKVIGKLMQPKLIALPTAASKRTLSGILLNVSALMVVLIGLVLAPMLVMRSPVDVLARREALITSLSRASTQHGPPNMASVLNLEHLLPAVPKSCSPATTLYSWPKSPRVECQVGPRFQQLKPNHFVLSLPYDQQYATILKSATQKTDGRAVSHNITRLIDGVVLCTFDPAEAYDAVTLNVITERPSYNITAPGHFGKRYLQRKALEQTGTDVSKWIGSDIALMSKTIQKMNAMLSTEVTAGVQATCNVTTQLALYVGRELQLIGKSTHSMLQKASRAEKEATKSLVQDLALIHNELVKFTQDFSVTVKESVELAKSNAKALVRSPLARSRQRVRELKQAIQHKTAAHRSEKADNVAGKASIDKSKKQRARAESTEKMRSKRGPGSCAHKVPRPVRPVAPRR